MKLMNMKLARIKKDLSQKELGNMLGVSSATINRIELGKQNVTLSRLKDIAKVLDVDMKEILEEEEQGGYLYEYKNDWGAVEIYKQHIS